MSTEDDMIAFVHACLDEEEQAASAATPGPWRHNPQKHHHIAGTPLFEEAVFAGPSGTDATCVAGTGETDNPQSMADAVHIVRHDPARTLRQTRAIRRILNDIQRYLSERRHEMGVWNTDRVPPLLPALATIWSDHPDYRREWGELAG